MLLPDAFQERMQSADDSEAARQCMNATKKFFSELMKQESCVTRENGVVTWAGWILAP